MLFPCEIRSGRVGQRRVYLYFAAGFVAVASSCTAQGQTPSHSVNAVDLEVYRAVLDSMFAPRTGSGSRRIAVLDSTETFPAENSAAVIATLLRTPEVDSVAARNLAARSQDAHSLKALGGFRLRSPLVLVDRLAIADLPRQDPDKYWAGFYERFPGTNGLTALSAVGYSASGDAAVLMVDVGCGSLCGNGYVVVVKLERGVWRIAKIEGTWVS
jgi:hypothetical protein